MVTSFSLDKYQSHIEDAERRVKKALSFQEPDRVPINISEYGSYWSRLFGYNIRDYYTNLEVSIEVQLKGFEWRLEHLRDDRTNYVLFYDPGPVAEGIYFGCPIEYPDDTSPRIVPILQTAEDIDKLETPEPEQVAKVKWYYEKFEEFKLLAHKMGVRIPVQEHAKLTIHPPLSAACAIMSSTLVYTYLYTEPEVIHRLLQKMFVAFCQLIDYADRRVGKKTTHLGLANDNACFISPEMYRKHVLPYDRQLYELYGTGWRYLHTDGPSDHLFKMVAEDLKVNMMDIGGFSNIDAAVRYLKGKTVIHGGLNGKDLYGGFDEVARAKTDHAIEVAAPGGGYEFAIGGETYPGVPPEALIDLVAYVKEKGKYPVKTCSAV